MTFEDARNTLGMAKHSVEIAVGEQTLTLETGYMAKQAAGSVIGRIGDSMVLSTVCDGEPLRPRLLPTDGGHADYAAGKIPGNFFRREARPSDRETLFHV